MSRFAIFVFAALPALAQVQATKTIADRTSPSAVLGQPVRISPGSFFPTERTFDEMLYKLGDPNSPIDLLGTTRGVYLEGYGAVFTSEISLVQAPAQTPFHTSITKEDVAKVYKIKTDRLQPLRNTMKEMMKVAARSLFLMPENQRIVVAVRLDYLQWENMSGMPGIIQMTADRKSALAGDIKIEEQ